MVLIRTSLAQWDMLSKLLITCERCEKQFNLTAYAEEINLSWNHIVLMWELYVAHFGG